MDPSISLEEFKTVKLVIQYDGTKYYGWQSQKGENTIQDSIQNAIKKIFPTQNIKLTGSGRTDSGVHAIGQVAHIKLKTEFSKKELKKAINGNLNNNDIWIKSCEYKADDFHSRFSAIKREYVYNITSEFSPLNRHIYYYYKYKINFDLLQNCADLILGEHDFSLFSKLNPEVNNKVCIVEYSSWKRQNNEFYFTIAANRFIHHMVRFLVGTMLEVSRGRYTISDFSNLIKNKKITNVIAVKAPAKGLILNKIFYEC